jgi:hydroxymethylpyrimidine/phosphomethylpyrimidine kinase
MRAELAAVNSRSDDDLSRGATARARVLVIAGHDSSGRAGVDVDRRALERLGVDGAFVVTAWTIQDERGVRELGAVPPERWSAEARRALDERTRAVKLGLLPGSAHVHAAVELARELRARASSLPIVVDPVLAASSGTVFLDEDARRTLVAELLPRGVVLTPNLAEAAALAGASERDLRADPAARVRAAELLLERGATAVFLKGGHAAEDPVRDLLLARGAPPRWHLHARAPRARLGGSGCRYASTVAARLALGGTLAEALEEAGAWLARAFASPEHA